MYIYIYICIYIYIYSNLSLFSNSCENICLNMFTHTEFDNESHKNGPNIKYNTERTKNTQIHVQVVVNNPYLSKNRRSFESAFPAHFYGWPLAGPYSCLYIYIYICIYICIKIYSIARVRSTAAIEWCAVLIFAAETHGAAASELRRHWPSRHSIDWFELWAPCASAWRPLKNLPVQTCWLLAINKTKIRNI